MLEVVVFINRMAVTKMPIKWQLVLELLHHILSILLLHSHSLLACIIRQKEATISHHYHHMIRLLHPSQVVDNITTCSLYGICIYHLQLPKMILPLFTWYHKCPVSSLLYNSTGNNYLLTQLNQSFKYKETRIKN